MERQSRAIGTAKRIRARMPFSGVRYAWHCRPFGFGRIIAPIAIGEIEIARDVYMDLATGTLRTEGRSERCSA